MIRYCDMCGEIHHDSAACLDVHIEPPKSEKQVTLKCKRKDQPLPARLRALANNMDELNGAVHKQYGYVMLEYGLTDGIRVFAAELEREE